jgi:hypothetical protein
MPKLGPVLTAALMAMLLAACGKSAEPPAQPAAKPAAKPTTTARNELPPPRCPARSDAALQGPDIVGLRLGMRAADALDAVRCTRADAVLSFGGPWIQQINSYGLKLERQSFEARVGDTAPCSYKNFSEMEKCGPGGVVWKHVAELIHVATPGVPGQETVQGIWRTQRFQEGAMPQAQAVVQALLDKYGPPQLRQDVAGGQVLLQWLADAQGRPLQPGTRAFSECQGVQARPDAAQRWTEGCGLSLAAQLVPPRSNPALVQEVHVGLLHQQQLFAFGQRFQAQLQALDQARRQKEVDAARGAGGAVKL